MDDKVQRLANKALLSLSQSLAGGHSDALKTYLATMSRFHRYSWFNALLIWCSRPDSTHVAGFHKWKEMGRFVRQGEKGIAILAPIAPKKRVAEEEPKETELRARGFVPVYVWDISQTEGQELPSIGKRQGDPGLHLERLKAFVQESSIALEYVNSLGRAEGRSSGNHIKLRSGMTPAEEFGVLAHEVCHELLHQNGQRGDKPKKVLELEAEAVAFAVCEGVGIQNGSASSDYIHLYQGDPQLLMASLACIQKTATQILKAILE